ncbi:hypothetical protein PHYSODRAFT_354169 [Phytophthora sojae]|uniref:Uncharacterized protein n=1 Tax=Phytophthora sojae (strain P6497) TaxID=1094619 RepID=G4Z9L6_PHYSP|nr:hypothetical protein PHYSODRAFT_354169 [Phytophthora sojae]EGZ19130.1 hypothetical protein PHYSODRAFT_354169 [Phytophthora sojae]|eukprot:XP_009521847.1 hypothetical protein PHYSODRAFT_354169 [Phytophthora sojae]
MDLASRNGHLEVVQWLHHNRLEGCTTEAMDGAASGGHLDIVKWLHDHTSAGCTTNAMDGAASSGHLDVVRWLHEHRSEGCTTRAMDGAAACGALDVVKWLNQGLHDRCNGRGGSTWPHPSNSMAPRASDRRLHNSSNEECCISWRVWSVSAFAQDVKAGSYGRGGKRGVLIDGYARLA